LIKTAFAILLVVAAVSLPTVNRMRANVPVGGTDPCNFWRKTITVNYPAAYERPQCLWRTGALRKDLEDGANEAVRLSPDKASSRLSGMTFPAGRYTIFRSQPDKWTLIITNIQASQAPLQG